MVAKDAKCKLSKLEISLQKTKQGIGCEPGARDPQDAPGHQDHNIQEAAGWKGVQVRAGTTLQGARKEEIAMH